MSEEATLDEFVEESEKPEVSEPTVPDSWRVTRADELMEITRGASPRPKGDPELFGGDIPWVKIGDVDVKNARYTGDTEDTVTEKGAKKSKLVDSGTLLVSNSGTCGYPMFAGVQSCVHDGWLILRNYEDILNPHYLYEYIGWKQNYLKSLAPGSTQINLNTSRMGVLEINIPPLPEQRNIATVLYTIDRTIEKTEKIIEQLDTLKSGIVQKVFKEGTRNHESFQTTKSGEVPEEWELARFEEVITDTRYGTDTKSNTESNGYPTLRIPNVVNKRITVDDLKHTPLNSDEIERLVLKNGDILVIRTNGNPDYVGRCATFHERDEPFVFASYLIRVRVDESRVRPAYVREFLNSPRGRSEMAGWIRSSAGNYNLSVGSMEKFQIPIPSLEEQDEIVEKMAEVEKTIETNRDYRNSLHRLKQGLQQDLLSGTVRTTDTNIEVPNKIAQHG